MDVVALISAGILKSKSQMVSLAVAVSVVGDKISPILIKGVFPKASLNVAFKVISSPPLSGVASFSHSITTVGEVVSKMKVMLLPPE